MFSTLVLQVSAKDAGLEDDRMADDRGVDRCALDGEWSRGLHKTSAHTDPIRCALRKQSNLANKPCISEGALWWFSQMMGRSAASAAYTDAPWEGSCLSSHTNAAISTLSRRTEIDYESGNGVA